MATVTKDFRVKNGLIVEGSTATVNSSNILTEASTEFLQDTTAGMFDGSHTGVSFSYNDTTGKLTASVDANPAFTTSITFEGATADAYETTLQVVDPTADRTISIPDASGTLALTSQIPSAYTDEMAQDAIGNALGTGLSYNDTTGAISVTANTYDAYGAASTVAGNLSTHEGLTSAHGVSGAVVGTTDSQTLTNKTLTSPVVTGLTLNDASIVFEGATPNEFETTLTVTDPTADRTITLPNVTGTVVTTGDTGSVTNTMLAGSIANDKLSNSAITINGTSTSLGGSRTLGSDDIAEGSTNKYFTDERAQDAIGNAVGNGLDYDDASGAISVDPSEFALSAVGAPTAAVSMATYKITNLGAPESDTDAANKAYVDSATAGLNVHESVQAATTTNINLSTALENGDLLDGVTLATGNRVLVKNQTTKSQNGIYVVKVSGAPDRAADYNSVPEVDAGDFVFVEAGTANGKTGWVQTNTIATIGSDAIEFTQFSGAGTYLAGNGLTLTGNSFSIDTAITADLSSTQTLTNKTINGSSNTISNIANSSLSNSAITINGTSVSLGGTRTLGSDDISEGSTNKYFTDERAQDAVGNALGTGLGYDDNTGTISNTGVTGLTGTTNQISVSASTGSVTLSLPQSINTTSSPTFAALSVGSGSVTAGSVTLADALIGTATQALTNGSATVVDSWAVASYSSAKYIVQMKNGNDIEVLEVLVTVDGNNNVYLTEYADVISNAQIGTTDADYLSGNVRLKVTASDGTTVKVHKTLIEA